MISHKKGLAPAGPGDSHDRVTSLAYGPFWGPDDMVAPLLSGTHHSSGPFSAVRLPKP